MLHHFCVEVAEKVGVVEAVVLQNIYFWVKNNREKQINYYEGRYWTYNSIKAFREIFPYLSEKQIRTAFKHLHDAGVLLMGNFNASTYDRTKWYTITDYGMELMQTYETDKPDNKKSASDLETEIDTEDKSALDNEGKSILPKGQMDLSKKENGFVQKGEPIPDNKPYSKPYGKHIYVIYVVVDKNRTIKTKIQQHNHDSIIPPTVAEVQEYCTKRSNTVDANKFVDYYTANGWKVGRNHMQDWKAAIRVWETKEKANGTVGKNGFVAVPKKKNGFINYTQREWDYDELERLDRESMQKWLVDDLAAEQSQAVDW
jgi:hypothetical protein